MAKQMHNLAVTDPDYAALYIRCTQEFLMAACDLPKPVFGGAVATLAFSSNLRPHKLRLLWAQVATFVPPVQKPDAVPSVQIMVMHP